MNLPKKPEAHHDTPRALTTQEQRNLIIGMVRSGQAELQTDNSGQLVVLTGLFKWRDGSIRTEEEQNQDDRVL
jgi:hypothetical protein